MKKDGNMKGPDTELVTALLLNALRDLLLEDTPGGAPARAVDENSPLTGAGAVIDSYARILFLVRAEDCCRERGIAFDSDSGGYPLHTVGALAKYLTEQTSGKGAQG